MSPLWRNLNHARTGANWALSFLTTEVRGMQAARIFWRSSLTSSVLALLRAIGCSPTSSVRVRSLICITSRSEFLTPFLLASPVSAYMLIPEIARRDEEAQKKDWIPWWWGISVLVAQEGGQPAILTNFSCPCRGLARRSCLPSRILLCKQSFSAFQISRPRSPQTPLHALRDFSDRLQPRYHVRALPRSIHTTAFRVPFGESSSARHCISRSKSLDFERRLLATLPRFTEARAFLDTIRLHFRASRSMNQPPFWPPRACGQPLGRFDFDFYGSSHTTCRLSRFQSSAQVTRPRPSRPLAYAFSRGESLEYLAQVAIAARQILFWRSRDRAHDRLARAHVVRAVLGTGALRLDRHAHSAAALALFVVSLAAQGLTLLLLRALYAAGKTAIPFIVSGVTAALTLTLGVWLSRSFRAK